MWTRAIAVWTLNVALGSWGLLSILACCNARTVRQSALMPYAAMTPPPTSHGRGDLYASASGLTYLDPVTSEDLGHWVPTAQLQVAGNIRPWSGLTLRPMGMVAISGDAGPVTPGIVELPRQTSFSFGLDVGFTFGSERVGYLLRPHVGLAALGLGMRIEDPALPGPRETTGWTGVVAGGLDGGAWVTPWLLLQLGIEMSNAPRVPSAIALCDGDDAPVVDLGVFALSVRVALEVEIEHTVSLVASAAMPALGSPYEPYPIVSGGVRGVFGEAPARQPFEAR